MELVKYFIIAFFLSALGTIPIGLITLTIAQKTLEKGKVAGWQIAMGATVIEFVYTLIACLLYTSPSPRDQRGSRMPSSA